MAETKILFYFIEAHEIYDTKEISSKWKQKTKLLEMDDGVKAL